MHMQDMVQGDSPYLEKSEVTTIDEYSKRGSEHWRRPEVAGATGGGG